MKTRHLGTKQVDKFCDYYARLEVLIRDCLENDEIRLASGIIRTEARAMHASRKSAEQAGLACIRGLGVAVEGVGFAVKQNRNKTAWRIRFFAAHQAA